MNASVAAHSPESPATNTAAALVLLHHGPVVAVAAKSVPVPAAVIAAVEVATCTDSLHLAALDLQQQQLQLRDRSCRRLAQKACVSCRKLKASCDDHRPCSRCVKSCRECLDRGEDDVEAARQRRKRTRKVIAEPCMDVVTIGEDRPVAAASSFSACPIVGIPPHMRSPGTALLSAQLYSRSVLGVLVKIGLRDIILRVQAQMSVLPLKIQAMLQWHTQCSIMCMNLSDLLTPSDYAIFCTHGLTQAQIDSPAFARMPLLPWARLSTRPFHYAVQLASSPCIQGDMTQPEQLDLTLASSSASSLEVLKSSSSTASDCSTVIEGGGSSVITQGSDSPRPCRLAQMRVEWLPASRAAFQQRERADSERQQRAMKRGEENLLAMALSPIPPAGDQEEQRTLAHLLASAAQDVVKEEIAEKPTEDRSNEETTKMTALIDTMSSLAVCRSLSVIPPTILPPYEPRHACWCPLAAVAVAQEDDTPKRMRLEATPSTATAVEPLICVCETSTPLPVRVVVNSAFERLFGWSQREVEKGLMSEGGMFLRKWHPPSIWPELQTAQVCQWRSLMKMIGHMAARAVKFCCPSSSSSSVVVNAPAAASATSSAGTIALPTNERPSPSHTVHTQLLNKDGVILPCIMRKHPTTGLDGMPSGYVTSWEVVSQDETI